MQLEVLVADITTLDLDAIVSAANTALSDGGSGGGGVEGAIHRAAGPELAVATRRFAPCLHGNAVITPGFRLPARYVIHAVGPVWRGGDQREADVLRSTYRRSLELAGEAHLASIAFPCISVGSFGYPREPAARIAVDTVRAEATRHETIERVVFCCYNEMDAEVYRRLLPA